MGLWMGVHMAVVRGGQTAVTCVLYPMLVSGSDARGQGAVTRYRVAGE